MLIVMIVDDWDAVSAETTWKFAWTSIWYTSLASVRFAHLEASHLQFD